MAADGISRWDCVSVVVNLRAVQPDIPWQEQDLGDAVTSLCTSVLASNSCETPLRPRLNALIRGILAHGLTLGYVVACLYSSSVAEIE